jgi:hypothetical protein
MTIASSFCLDPFRRSPIVDTSQEPEQPVVDQLTFFHVQSVLDGGITGDLGEQTVTGRHLRQVQLRFNADPFEGLELLRGERVVEVFSDGVGVFGESSTIRPGRANRGPADGHSDPLHEVRGDDT